MKHAVQQKHLPYAPADIFDLIMDVGSYPAVFPMVKSAKVLSTQGGAQDVALEFILPPLAPVKDPVHVARVTSCKPDWIAAQRLKSPLKAMDMRWDLKSSAQGGTDMTFQMDYELGFGFLVNALLQTHIDDLLKKSMTRFEGHAAQRLTPVAAVPLHPAKKPTPGSP